jgi:hypothetical protein
MSKMRRKLTLLEDSESEAGSIDFEESGWDESGVAVQLRAIEEQEAEEEGLDEDEDEEIEDEGGAQEEPDGPEEPEGEEEEVLVIDDDEEEVGLIGELEPPRLPARAGAGGWTGGSGQQPLRSTSAAEGPSTPSSRLGWPQPCLLLPFARPVQVLAARAEAGLEVIHIDYAAQFAGACRPIARVRTGTDSDGFGQFKVTGAKGGAGLLPLAVGAGAGAGVGLKRKPATAKRAAPPKRAKGTVPPRAVIPTMPAPRPGGGGAGAVPRLLGASAQPPGRGATDGGFWSGHRRDGPRPKGLHPDL